MKKKLCKQSNLSNLSIGEFEFPITINSNDEIIMTATSLDREISIFFVGVLYFHFATDDFTDSETYCPVIEIEHFYRKLSKEELNKYGFSPTENIFNDFFNIVTIHCGNVIEIVCRDIKVLDW